MDVGGCERGTSHLSARRDVSSGLPECHGVSSPVKLVMTPGFCLQIQMIARRSEEVKSPLQREPPMLQALMPFAATAGIGEEENPPQKKGQRKSIGAKANKI